MGKTFKVDDGGLPLIPEGEYKAVFVGYEEKKGLAYGDALKLSFEITEGDYKNTVLNTLVSERLSPQSRFGQIVRSLQRKPLKISDDVDLDNLVNLACIIKVTTEPGKANYADFSSISEVKPMIENPMPF